MMLVMSRPLLLTLVTTRRKQATSKKQPEQHLLTDLLNAYSFRVCRVTPITWQTTG